MGDTKDGYSCCDGGMRREYLTRGSTPRCQANRGLDARNGDLSSTIITPHSCHQPLTHKFSSWGGARGEQEYQELVSSRVYWSRGRPAAANALLNPV